MTATAADTVAERLAGGQPSRTRSALVATVASVATGVAVYRLLRSGTSEGDKQRRSDSNGD
jgi:hypothetical protein